MESQPVGSQGRSSSGRDSGLVMIRNSQKRRRGGGVAVVGREGGEEEEAGVFDPFGVMDGGG